MKIGGGENVTRIRSKLSSQQPIESSVDFAPPFSLIYCPDLKLVGIQVGCQNKF